MAQEKARLLAAEWPLGNRNSPGQRFTDGRSISTASTKCVCEPAAARDLSKYSRQRPIARAPIGGTAEV